MTVPRDNQLLSMLTADDLVVLGDHMIVVDLRSGQTLAKPGDQIRRVYFPHSGIVSFMVELEAGQLVQTAMVGRDGVIGASQALDDRTSINKIVVQVPGTAMAIDRERLLQAIRAGSSIDRLLATYEQFFVADIQQTAACNASHSVEARMCRWMLRMLDLSGSDIAITQESLATMIGAQRSSVSQLAGQMQAEGIIRYSRGQIHIENSSALKQLSCECHEAVKRNYSDLFGFATLTNRTE